MFVIIGIAIIRWLAIGMPAFLLICVESIKIEIPEIVLIWYAGMIWGSVSVALSFSFTANDEKLRSIVLLIALITSLTLASLSWDVTSGLGFTKKPSLLLY